MKNGKLVTTLLDECAMRLEMIESDDIAILEAFERLIESEHTEQLWQACLDDGWTFAELEAFYYRRFPDAPRAAYAALRDMGQTIDALPGDE